VARPRRHLALSPPESASGSRASEASEVGSGVYLITVINIKTMSTEGKDIRNYWLTVRLSEQEHSHLQQYFRESTCRQLSDYVRKIVLNRPVNIKYRNVSVDDFLKEMLHLKKELNAIGNNFNQAVHKLHTLDRIPEFQQWILRTEQDKAILFTKIDTILSRLHELYLIWSQS
jgi:hypothetical protein